MAPDSSTIQVGHAIVIVALVLYIVVSQSMTCAYRNRSLSEGFSNLNDSLDFILTDASGAMSTYSVADLGSEISNQIQATATNTVQRAVQVSGSALDNLHGRIDAANGALGGLMKQLGALSAATVRSDKTYQLHSQAWQNAPNCLDGGSGGQQCNWDNAYRRFAFQETPYDLRSAVNQNNQASTTYTDKGCWIDASNRALSYVANDYKTGYTVQTCAAEAAKKKSNTFALQAGGNCWVAQGADDYTKYGPSDQPCDPLGGGWVNHVYVNSQW